MKDLFATPGMIVMTILIALTQIVTLCLMGMILGEFRRMVHRRNSLIGAIEGRETAERYHTGVAWLYVICTILLIVVSTLLFVFQPHLL